MPPTISRITILAAPMSLVGLTASSRFSWLVEKDAILSKIAGLKSLRNHVLEHTSIEACTELFNPYQLILSIIVCNLY